MRRGIRLSGQFVEQFITEAQLGRERRTLEHLDDQGQSGLALRTIPPYGQGTRAEQAVLEMGGDSTASSSSRATEAAVRGFWKQYRVLMGV